MDYSNMCFLFTVPPHIIPDCICMFYLPVDHSAFTNRGKWIAFFGE